jgi:hypothetical protein
MKIPTGYHVSTTNIHSLPGVQVYASEWGQGATKALPYALQAWLQDDGRITLVRVAPIACDALGNRLVWQCQNEVTGLTFEQLDQWVAQQPAEAAPDWAITPCSACGTRHLSADLWRCYGCRRQVCNACRSGHDCGSAAFGRGKRRIRCTVWGNWYGYVGTKRVTMFGNSSTETAEQEAQRWLNGGGR